MSWLELFTLGLVATVVVVCVASYASGYLGEMFRRYGRPWLAHRSRRPVLNARDMDGFRHELALWKGRRP